VNTLAEFGVGELLWSMLWFTLFFIWIWILITVVMDLFRDHELSGWGKFGWLFFIIVLPYLGVFVYLIARGQGMAARQMATAKANAEAQREYIQSVAGPSAGSSTAEELARLADLKEKGVITDEEFAALKAKAIG
jgi:hypothetical protein